MHTLRSKYVYTCQKGFGKPASSGSPPANALIVKLPVFHALLCADALGNC